MTQTEDTGLSGPLATPPTPAWSATARHPGDMIRVAVGLLAMFVSLLAVQRNRITMFETDVFRLVNDLPSRLSIVLGPVMQLGNVFAAPAVGLLALLVMRRHWRVAVDVTLSGVVAWFAAKIIKSLVDRPRPGGLVEDINRIASPEGLGFVSGHTAVAAAIVTAAAPYLPRRVRRAIWVLPWMVGAARVYYGAHLPLDIIGGAAVGWIIGASVHLVFGAPHRVPHLADAEEVLRRAGMEPRDLVLVGHHPRGSFPFVAEVADRRQFVKLLDPEPRDRDWLYRVARMLLAREVRDEAALLDGPAQAHREAAMALLARTNGARVPEIRGVQTQGDRVWVIQEHVRGCQLTWLTDADLPDAVLDDLWTQVQHLRDGRVAHQDLVADNVILDEQRRIWLVDFAHARTADSDRALDHDVAELLVTTAMVVGARRAVAAAARRLGIGPVAAALPTLQPLALTPENRAGLRTQPGLLDELRAEVAASVGVPATPFPMIHPDPWRYALALGVSVGTGVALVLVAGAGAVADAFSAAGLRWMGLAALAALAAPFASAAAQIAASDRRIALGRMAAMCAARGGTSLSDGPALGEDIARAFHERTGLPPEQSDRIRRVTGRSRMVALALTGAAAVAVAAAQSVSVSRPPDLGAFAAIGGVALALQLLRPDPRRLPSASPGRAPIPRRVLLASIAEVAVRALVAIAAASAFGSAPAAAAVAAVALLVIVLGRFAPMAGVPGVGSIVHVVGLTSLGMPVAEAVGAAVLVAALQLWLPMLNARPMRRLALR